MTGFGSIADTFTLTGGVEMPRFGLGTYKTAEGAEVEASVEVALESGYRLVDTASLYANEEGVGRAIRASGIARGDVFITTKLWNSDQGAASTRAAVDLSLERLGTEYVDLYLIHWPIPELMAETWSAMEDAVAEGKVLAIGVCNFLEHHLEQLRQTATVPPAVDQFEFHMRLQQPDLIEYCDRHNIVVQAWAPLMRGMVAEIPEVRDVAEAHGVSPVQVAIRWVLQRGIGVIPKSVHAKRIRSNADVFEFELSATEMALLDGLDAAERLGRHPDNVDF